MKKSAWSRALSMILVLAMAAMWLPAGIAPASAAEGGGFPPDDPPFFDSGFSGYSGDGGFVPGEVLALADSWAHAKTIADEYGLALKSYAYGIAALAAPDPEMEVARSGMMRRVGVPKLSLNMIYYVSGASEAAPKTDYRNDTDFRTTAAYDHYAHVADRRTTSRQALFNAPEEAPVVPGDPVAGQWHHYEMDTVRAWGLSKGSGVVVAVIDTGIDVNNPAFAGRLSPLAYNSHTNRVGLGNVQDDYGHGTHVSGIVAASMDEAASACGVAPQAAILTIKANNPAFVSSLTTLSWLRGINYAVENGADIVNMSFGRHYEGGPYEAEGGMIAEAVISNAIAKGVTLIAAAGNDAYGHASYPAAYPGVIAVSATEPGFRFSRSFGGHGHSGSNHGPEIDIAAPGSWINSTVIGGGHEPWSGTSMASPNVAGVAALIKSLNPSYTPQKVRDVLCETARDAGEIGWDEFFGHGVVNAYAAVLGPDTLFNVVYDFNDGSRSPVTVKVVPGDTLPETDAPLRDGYAFAGWYVSGTNDEFGYSRPVEGNLKLDARWVAAEAGMYILEFPDPNFRRGAMRALIDQCGVRRNESDFVAGDLALLASMTWLDVGNMGIYDMTGLKYFTGLEELRCYGNYLTELDISSCLSLIYFFCSENQLTKLNVSKNTALEWLHCQYNQISGLDVSKNLALVSLACFGNLLTELDVSANTSLWALECDDNWLTVLDVSKNLALEIFWCNGNLLTGLDVSKNTALDTLVCAENPLNVLDVTKNTALLGLNCGYNRLSSLDVSKNALLELLYCSDNYLTGIDLSRNAKLIDLWCNQNRLTGLDLSKNTALEWLGCSYNNLSALDVSNNAALEWLDCTHNNLSELDVSGNAALDLLVCSYNNLTELDVSKNAALGWLDCAYNNLTELDVSNNAALEMLDCSRNYIASIDKVVGWESIPGLILNETFYFYPQRSVPVDITADFIDPSFRAAVYEIIEKTAPEPILSSDVEEIGLLFITDRGIRNLAGLEHFSGLYALNCGWNQLTKLPELPSGLGWLHCDNNTLTSLPDLPDSLQYLDCYNNMLTSLPKLPDSLQSLYCDNNMLKSLPDLPDSLQSLYCSSNILTSLPKLPDSLKYLECYSNILTSLPELPDGLLRLFCPNNQLSSLPKLPDSLQYLDCYGNILTSLPKLPVGLDRLSCGQNRLTGFDVTGLDALEYISCYQNYMTDVSDVTGFLGEWYDGEGWEDGFSFFFWPQHVPGFKAVTNFAGLPRFAFAGEPLKLTCTVVPSDVTYQEIEWLVLFDPDETGAAIEGNVFLASSPGVVEALVVIVGENAVQTYSFGFNITVLLKTHTVTFDLNGGTRTGGGPLVQEVGEGGAAVAPNVTRTGYRFDGWDTDFSNVTRDMTVTARWTRICTVTFDLNGGTRTGGGELVQTVPEGGAAVAPTVTRSNYTFSGWDKPFGYVTADMTVTAQWTLIDVLPGGGGAPAPSFAVATFTVTFDTKGGSAVAEQSVAQGGKVAIPADPTRAGYDFAGWYADADLTTPYDFNKEVTDSFTLYAKWAETIPDIPPPLAPFIDVDAGAWFFDAVMYVFANDLMKGTSDIKFSPNATMDRAMLVTVLYRLEGEPAVSGTITFTDVESGKWYSDAILWASQNDIVNGYGSGAFGLSDSVTREQAVTILYRYAKFKGLDVSASADLSMYTDMGDISGWALDAMKWAVAVGIIQGRTPTTIVPKGTSTRAEVATIVKRYIEDVISEEPDTDDPDE